MSTCFRCCACGLGFGEREALCEDWSDPERSFICPGCGTYLLRADRAGVHVIDGRRLPWRRWLARLPAVLAVLLGALLMDRIRGDRGALAVLLLGGATLVLWVLRGSGTMPAEETVRVEDLHPDRPLH